MATTNYPHDDHVVDLDDQKPPVTKTHSKVEVPIYNDVERVQSTDISLGAILKGTAANPMTTFEKKAALINVELDKFGLGRYQICIWFLCGFGYFLDLAWSQGVGLIATAIYQEMDVPDARAGDIWSLANAGLAIGALTFGLLVDVIGRKWAFNLTCLITSVFGLLMVCLELSVWTEWITYSHPGRPQIQLRSRLRNLLPRESRPWRQHPHRRDHRPRIPPPIPAQPRLPALPLATHRCRRRLGNCLRHRRKVSLRRQASLVQGCRRGRSMLHSLEQHGLALSRHRSRLRHPAHLLPPLLHLHIPRVAQVFAFARKRGRSHRGLA